MIARAASSLALVVVLSLVAGAVAHATTPGVNGRIVFSSSRAQSSVPQLYSSNPDGSALARLTQTSDAEQEPVWSPDGTHIAWVRLHGSTASLWTMNADGSGARQVTPADGFSVIVSRPTWSPDGSQLAFAGWRSIDTSWAIWISNADGSNLHRLSTSDSFPLDPTWSPDGTQIAFAAGTSIVVRGLDGTGGRRVTTPPAGSTDEAPDWSPDGAAIAFERRVTSTSSTDVYTVGADGSDPRALTASGDAFGPSWSPDGTKLAFYALGSDGASQLLAMDRQGSNVVPLDPSGVRDLRPHWGTSTAVPVVPDAPAIHFFSPQPGQVMLPGDRVPAYYTCDSAVSFVVSCSGSVPLLGFVDTSTAGDKTLTVTATDLDGRTSTAALSYTVLDVVPPTVHLRTPADGAVYGLNAPVDVDYDCADDPAGLGLATCEGTLPSGFRLPTSVAGSYSFTVVAVDRANHVTVTTVHYKIADRTPPTVVVDAPADGAVYTLGDAAPAPQYRCADEPGGSGLASCRATPLDTSSVGAKTFTVTATDNAGNTTTVSRSYTVAYAFTGFLAPTASYPAPTPADAGQSVKVRFSLAGNQGLGVVSDGVWTSCDGGAPTHAPGTVSYQSTQDRYAYEVQTPKSWAGSCRDLVLTLADGTLHRARFQFGK